jgi:hypothetical protein
MKFALASVFCLLAFAPGFAFAEDQAPAAQVETGKSGTDVNPPVAAEATQGLFQRVSGAYGRAVRHGNLAVRGTVETAPASQQAPVKQ